MRTIAAAIALLAACGQQYPCDPGYDDLTTWAADPQSPDNSVDVDPACSSRATLRLRSTAPAYLGRSQSYPASSALAMVAQFAAACDPLDGQIVSGILESGDKVDYRAGSLSSRTDSVAWTTTAGPISFMVGAVAAHPCDVSVQIRSTR